MAYKQIIVYPKELETSQTLQFTLTYPLDLIGIYLSGGAADRTVQLWIKKANDVSVLDSRRLLQNTPVIATDFTRVGGEIDIPLQAGDSIYASSSGSGVNILLVAEDPRV